MTRALNVRKDSRHSASTTVKGGNSMGIHILTPEVAAQIAAGEVVERPASMVKELVENAIDAGATRITVDLQGGGTTALRVTDNGCGIARDELPLAFARHATSKIAVIDDLGRLYTLGFRGEALASIGAVAAVTIASRQEGEPSGSRIGMLHGTPEATTTVAMPVGTIITVRDLFAQVPARLKFLKSAQTEASACMQLLEKFALAYPETQFTVTSDNRLALRTPGDGLLTSAIAGVYDHKVAEQMVEISYGESDENAALPLFDRSPIISGITSRPACYKSTRQHIALFVNRRWVRNQSLTYAVEEAYHSLLLTGRHPVSIINITLDPALLDVNVHPAKTEIKFARERQVYAAVQRAVRSAIVGTTEAPAFSTHAFTPAAPVVGGNSTLLNPPPSFTRPTATPPLWNADELRQTQSGILPQPVAVPPPPAHLPALRVLGQISQSYIITEGPDGVYLIDQHAAHERILLEKMVAQWRNQALPGQALLEPLVVELTGDVFAAVDDRLDDLRKLNFDIEPFGVSTMLVRAVPSPLAKAATAEALQDLLPDLVGAEGAGHTETWEEHALANIACHAAIKQGQTLAPEEQRELVRQLETVDARHSCCHGRPTTVHLSIDALEKEFARR